eukprot:5666873-Amphidinium_carterae.2
MAWSAQRAAALMIHETASFDNTGTGRPSAPVSGVPTQDQQALLVLLAYTKTKQSREMQRCASSVRRWSSLRTLSGRATTSFPRIFRRRAAKVRRLIHVGQQRRAAKGRAVCWRAVADKEVGPFALLSKQAWIRSRLRADPTSGYR